MHAVAPISLPSGREALVADSSPQRQEHGGIAVTWAQHQDEVREAQKLRYDVFAREMGARLHTTVADHDVDLFDPYCEHLLVRDQASGQVIGT